MCVYACWDWYVSCNGVEIIPRLVKVAAENSVCCSPYQHCQSRYLRGESPRTGNFTVHLQYPFTVQSTFFLFLMKPQLPHCWFSTPLCCSLSLFFFRALRHWAVVFSLLTVHRKCVGAKTGPCHCFHSSLRTTELNLNPITRSQVPKILTSPYIEV